MQHRPLAFYHTRKRIPVSIVNCGVVHIGRGILIDRKSKFFAITIAEVVVVTFNFAVAYVVWGLLDYFVFKHRQGQMGVVFHDVIIVVTVHHFVVISSFHRPAMGPWCRAE